MQDKVFLIELKEEQIKKLKQRQEDKILEKENADFLIKLIQNAESKEDVLKLSALGMSLKRTGFHFDVRLEKSDRTIKYFVKNEKLSFEPLSEAKSAIYRSKQGEAEVSLVNATLEQKITHTLIIGDNYPALLNLLINYKRKIKVIYIDPPYGKDDLGEFAKTNYDNTITRDNLLSMLYPRLQLAKMLLKDDGVIFCSIDDRNQAYVKGLFDEVFGEGNFCGNIVWLKGNAQNDADTIQRNQEYILCYAKDIATKPINTLLYKEKVKAFKDEKTGKFYYEGAGLTMGGGDGGSLENRPNLGYTFYYNPQTNDIKPLLDYDKDSVKTITNHDELYNDNEKLIEQGYVPIRPPKMGVGNGCWKWALEKTLNELDRILIKAGKNGYSVLRKEWLDSKQVKQDENGNYYAMIDKENPPKSFIDFVGSGLGTKLLTSIMENKVFNNPKPMTLIKHLLKISTINPSDYVDLQVDSMDCYDFANAKSRNDKGTHTNATTTGGGQTRRIA